MAPATAEVVSWSKDTIHVRWRFEDISQSDVGGYEIRYQAVGSNVVQLSSLLDLSSNAYSITHLHENTNYDICILRKLKTILDDDESSTWSAASLTTKASACVQGTTSTDSLSVALGSTFGAFLALGLIVALVFVAKWQHSRRAKRRQQAAAQVAGNGTAATAQLDNNEAADDVLRVEISELVTASMPTTPTAGDNASTRVDVIEQFPLRLQPTDDDMMLSCDDHTAGAGPHADSFGS